MAPSLFVPGLESEALRRLLAQLAPVCLQCASVCLQCASVCLQCASSVLALWIGSVYYSLDGFTGRLSTSSVQLYVVLPWRFYMPPYPQLFCIACIFGKGNDVNFASA